MNKCVSHDQLLVQVARELTDIRHLVISEGELNLSSANGLHIVAKHLVREQRQRGANSKIVFLCPQERDGLDEQSDVPLLYIPMQGRKLKGHQISLNSESLAALISGYSKKTLFHIHGGRQPLLLFISRELKRRGIPYVITIHGRYSHIFDEQMQVRHRTTAIYLKLIEKWILEQALFVQAITSFEHAIVQHVAPRARIEIVPNAAYSSALDAMPHAPDRKETSSEFPTFGYCGRFAIEHKGIDLLLAGFSQYRRAGGQGRLMLIGTGTARDRIDTMLKEFHLDGSVSIGGPLFGPEKERMIRTWDFFLMPSRFDVLPTAALEAALIGTPLIVSTATGFQPYLERFKGGVSIESLSADAVAEALNQASNLSTQEWLEMSSRAYSMALEIGDWTNISATLERLYRKHSFSL